MTIHVVGRGIVATRFARLLRGRPIRFHDPYGPGPRETGAGEVVVLAHDRRQAALVPDLIDGGTHVVTIGDALSDTRELLELDMAAAAAGSTLVIGAALSPGLVGLLARHLADQLETFDEIHVAIHGTAGPACARAHHRALSGTSIGWHDGRWVEYLGGSGRELCWFPEPVGAQDCYRARIAAPLQLHRTFPEAERISVRRSATRRDRLTARLPMLRPPHHEGGIGALRVEVRGSDDTGGRECLIAGVAELIGLAAAATAAAFTTALLDGRLPTGAVVAGDASLPNLDLLRRVESFGVRLQEFTGVPQPGSGRRSARSAA